MIRNLNRSVFGRVEQGYGARIWDLRLLIPMTTWCVYAGFLLVYNYQGRRGRFSAVWSIVGFVLVLVSLLFELAVLTLGKH